MSHPDNLILVSALWSDCGFSEENMKPDLLKQGLAKISNYGVVSIIELLSGSFQCVFNPSVLTQLTFCINYH